MMRRKRNDNMTNSQIILNQTRFELEVLIGFYCGDSQHEVIAPSCLDETQNKTVIAPGYAHGTWQGYTLDEMGSVKRSEIMGKSFPVLSSTYVISSPMHSYATQRIHWRTIKKE